MSLSRYLVFILVAAVFTAPAWAQLDPQDALAALETAPDLEVTLFASEPQLLNPTIIDVDAQGRVWVCEAANYRLFNQDEQRPAGDRIRVLEDTDGDGVCDSATTFYQDPSLQAPMGIAVLGSRVYVCQSPDLFYLEDTDGDGVADKRETVLTGFKGVDNDHAIHGVVWAPDGKLYFSNGDKGLDVTDKSGDRVHVSRDEPSPYRAAAVLRTDLEGQRLELLAHNMRNPYEPCVDVYGNVFISDNDDDGNEQCRINFVMEGGDYGYTPRRLGNKRLDAIHWNDDLAETVPPMIKTGFGSPCGITHYTGDTLPAQYRHTLLHADAGPRVIRSIPYQPDGAGFDASINIMLSSPDDSWFRPVDVCAAPDGSLFIADWYDAGVGGHRMADAQRGRIYRITAKGKTNYNVPPLDLDSIEGIRAAYTSPNIARQYLAHEKVKSLSQGEVTKIVKPLIKDNDPATRAHGLWLLAAANPSQAAMRAMQDDAAQVRAMALRIAPDPSAEWFSDVIADDSSAVRRHAMLVLQDANNETALPTLAKLATQLDPADRFYRQALGIAADGRESKLFTRLWQQSPEWSPQMAAIAFQLHPPEALPHAIAAANNDALNDDLRVMAARTIDAVGTPEAGDALVALLDTDKPEAVQSKLLNLLARNEGNDWNEILINPEIDTYLQEALTDSSVTSPALSFIRDTRRATMIPQVLDVAANDSATTDNRKQAFAVLQRLGRGADPSTAETVTARLKGVITNEPALAPDALRAVAGMPWRQAHPALLDAMANDDHDIGFRRDAMQLLSRNDAGQKQILQLAETGKLPQDLILDATEILHRAQNEDIRNRAAQVLPKPADSSGEPLPPIEKLVAMEGNPDKGRAIFMNEVSPQCIRCHIVNGEGQSVGPDLSTIGQKLSKQALFESILNPSAAIAHEYEVFTLETEWEGDYTGFIQRQTDTHYEIIDASGAVNTIDKNDIIGRRQSPLSLMPAGLAAAMTTQELVDLVAYLQTLK